MKHINKLSIVVFLCFTFASFSLSVFSAVQTVNTPLDGGLLTILGAAGVSYYLVRRRKKNSTGI